MTTPCSGEIGISHINTELQTAGIGRSLGQADGRSLCGVSSGLIALSDYYCRSGVMSAIGGTISTYVDANGWTWKVHTFWSTGTFQVISIGSSPLVDFLFITSGGSGGQPVGSPPRGAAGGGGGGTYAIGSFSVSVGAYIASVGVGGSNGANGDPTSVFGSSLPGGGSGGRYPNIAGNNGSSGGGGGQGSTNTPYINGGYPTATPGNAGGRSRMGDNCTNAGGGGGGGASGTGQDSQGIGYAKGTVYSIGGNGGNGVVVNFANTNHPVGGGGGGAGANTTLNETWSDWDGNVPGGGPGSGGVCVSGGTTYLSGGKGSDFVGDASSVGNNAPGVDGTGGGGGGGSFLVSGKKGGNGKIVIKYRIA